MSCIVDGCANMAIPGRKTGLCGRHERDRAALRPLFFCSACESPLRENADLCGFCLIEAGLAAA